MKISKITTIIIFILIIVTPLFMFNWEDGAVSKIDNRVLAEIPFMPNVPKGDLTESIEKCVEDRIGLRDKMILYYTILNDKLFGKMVHPSYSYGKEGYVFFKMGPNMRYGEFHETFADMVKKIQDYCYERNIVFLFVFNPSKTSVLTKYLPAGVSYDSNWVNQFLSALDKRNVNYVDNTGLLIEKSNNGEIVFNKQYDAGHWTDTGAYYGVNSMLEGLREQIPQIHINKKDEFRTTEKTMTSLPVSEFPIYEVIEEMNMKITVQDNTVQYDNEVKRDNRYRGFSYSINLSRLEENGPKALVFQGSYMNGKGNKFLKNSLGEYVAVHNYQNVINFPYYFNIFKPQCVIFEVTEYTFSDGYFNRKDMENMKLTPPLSSEINKDNVIIKRDKINNEDLSIEQGKALTKIIWKNTFKEALYVWLLLSEDEFDMQKIPNTIKYEVSVKNESYNKLKEKLKIIVKYDSEFIVYE
ncbi:alginate O-acetyltransferase AlgX-related protein [Cloacibacillus porcorum]|uniref:alginate O-acetyltransferase AlgX-related protein n=1 Tax=Cloacibacillus porcorum TaxID=1197717 RepID=UPI00267369AF|nr:hypothetical protein [Cloacibacillus porcorum]